MESSFHELEPWEVTEINEEPPFWFDYCFDFFYKKMKAILTKFNPDFWNPWQRMEYFEKKSVLFVSLCEILT